MLFPVFAMFVAGPMFIQHKDNKQLQDGFKQQGNTVEGINKMLRCHKPDPFKVSWDARQAEIAAGADPKSLPPLKQI
jgi:hypothetical protein